MVVAVQITIDAKGPSKLMSRISKRIGPSIEDAQFKYAERVKMSLRRSLLSGPVISRSRIKASKAIRAKKLRSRSEVLVPATLVRLDTSNAHYVSIRRGRNRLIRWVQRNYKSGIAVSGLSRVRRESDGRILKGSYLYVTPHPFINRGISKVRNQLRGLLKSAIRRSVAAGG